jgi:signal peptide peptidase SppA
MTPFAHLLARIADRPLLILPDKIAVILGGLGARLGLDAGALGLDLAEMNRFVGRRSEKGGYRVTEDGIAVVSILGTLVNRGAFVGAQSGLTSYEGLLHQLKTAAGDDRVRGLLLDLDTPGGEAAGCFEVPAAIREVRQKKPVVAFANDMACSAGYAIASAANEIWTTATGLVGSIGVVLVHIDRSQAMALAGLKPTIIAAGRRKADGNPFEPLPPHVRQRLQAEADAMRETFIAAVHAGRPQLSPEAIRATEAGVFMGREAVAAGLADGIASFDDALARLTRLAGPRRPQTSPASPKPQQETTRMTTTAPEAPAADHAQLEAAHLRGRAEGEKAGRAAERTRIAAILGHPEAKGREEQAQVLALETEMAPEEAAKVLAKAPKAEAKAAAAFYRAVAASGGDPKVRAEDAEASTGAQKSSLVAAMQARFKKGV